MKLLLSLFLFLCHLSAFGQEGTTEDSVTKERLNTVLTRQAELDKEIQQLFATSNKNAGNIQRLEQRNKDLRKNLDSLKHVCDSLKMTQTTDRTALNDRIQKTDNTVARNQSVLDNRSLWGGIMAALFVFISGGFMFCFSKRIKSGTNSIDEIRKAQEAMQSAQIKMQEESIKLDNKLLEIAERQMKTPAIGNHQDTAVIDHSLALKVADEIVRIELNLSRMDVSIKGYKQLAKAVQRIKDNFQANGYEIVDMLGKPYNEGMKVIANFVSDENMEQGRQIITGIIKPQINYNGKMIQSAQITVSQNI